MKHFFYGCVSIATLFFLTIGASFGRDNKDSAMPDGIYIGILSFSGQINEISKTSARNGKGETNFVPLDSWQTKQALIEKFKSDYVVANTNGTALYFAVHKALANLATDAANGNLPKNINNIIFITITDAHENASASSVFNDAIKTFPSKYRFPDAKRRDYDEYSKFIKDKITNVKINGKGITSYAFGLPGALADEMKIIADKQVPIPAPYGNSTLQHKLFDITNNIGKKEQMLLVAEFSPPYNNKKLKFKIDDNSWIIGTMIYRKGQYFFEVDKEKSTADLYADHKITQENDRSKNPFGIEFTLNKIFDVGPGELLEIREGGELLDTEAKVRLLPKPTIGRESDVVYFLLDNSMSMAQNIGIIQKTVSAIIDSCYERTIGSNEQTYDTGLNDAVLSPSADYLTAEECIQRWKTFVGSTSAQVRSDSYKYDFAIAQDIFPNGSLSSSTQQFLWIQIGTYNQKKGADAVESLLSPTLRSYVKVWEKDGKYKVRIGPFKTEKEAEEARSTILSISKSKPN